MKDIQNRADIELLIDEFYKAVLKDEKIGYIFTDVALLKWDIHIPIMYDFWESLLLDKIQYKGNPMIKHIELSKKISLSKEHFDQWLLLWKENVIRLFTGPKSEEAIFKATSIGDLMLHKIKHLTS